MTLTLLTRGRYRARFAEGDGDIVAAKRLRALCFLRDPDGLDEDAFDALTLHILVEEVESDRLVCCFRLLPLSDGGMIETSYAAQFYDLERLRAYPGTMAELGRFCIAPDIRDPDVLRVAWAALTSYVDQSGVEMLFGCSSFEGTDPALYGAAFDLLRLRHRAPETWRPGEKADEVLRFAGGDQVDLSAAARQIPTLLRTYLLMGGWVSDHAVIDRELSTLHVFTGLEIAAVPPKRAEALRQLAQGS